MHDSYCCKLSSFHRLSVLKFLVLNVLTDEDIAGRHHKLAISLRAVKQQNSSMLREDELAL